MGWGRSGWGRSYSAAEPFAPNNMLTSAQKTRMQRADIETGRRAKAQFFPMSELIRNVKRGKSWRWEYFFRRVPVKLS